MNNTIAVVLAAGEGKRMKSNTPKILHKAAGKALSEWVVDAAAEATGQTPVLVIGKNADAVKEYFGERVRYAVQSEPLGSGHAVMAAGEYLTGDGYVIVVAGDMPLIQAQTLSRLAQTAAKQGLGACLLTAAVDDATGYGRVIRGEDGGVKRIVEHRDATEEQKAIREINLSIYCFETALLREALASLKPNNAQGEYYLTDCIEYISAKGLRIEAVSCGSPDEWMGVNDRVQLADAAKKLRRRINNEFMVSGVTMIDPDSTYIDSTVTIGQDVTIYPGVTLEGSTVIEQSAVLYPGSRIADSTIGAGTTVQNSVVLSSTVGDNSTIGPYAYLRPNSRIGNGCRVGDFVEVKNATIKDGAKVSHLSYIGDGEIGEKSNIGCGVVFVNYDGKKKSKTIVGKNAFVGCNANLVAPVTIGDGAYIAAGSTVTKNVEEDALCIARSRQTVIEGWAKRRREE
jgi:bifunctional UDP-N-acetylglucosamine pyrophosphorylase/glucosamine-1-phosphate N-acetyltransferase